MSVVSKNSEVMLRCQDGAAIGSGRQGKVETGDEFRPEYIANWYHSIT